MTLQEWIDYYSQFGWSINYHESGAYWIPDRLDIGRPELFNLTDYIVSSISGGSIWLIRRSN